LLKGASRTARSEKGELPEEMIDEKRTAQQTQQELRNMLKEPKYLECFMIKTPLKPLRQNHKTQILFVFLFFVIFFTQLFVVIPSKQISSFNQCRPENIIFRLLDHNSEFHTRHIVFHCFEEGPWLPEAAVSFH